MAQSCDYEQLWGQPIAIVLTEELATTSPREPIPIHTCFRHMTTDEPSAPRTINDDTHGGLPPAATETWRQVPVGVYPLSDNRGTNKNTHFSHFHWPVQMTCFALGAFNYLFLEDGIFLIIFFKPWGPWGHTWNRQTAFLPAVASFTLMFERRGCKLHIGCKIWEKCTTNQKTAGGDMDLKVAGASPKWWLRITVIHHPSKSGDHLVLKGQKRCEFIILNNQHFHLVEKSESSAHQSSTQSHGMLWKAVVALVTHGIIRNT